MGVQSTLFFLRILRGLMQTIQREKVVTAGSCVLTSKLSTEYVIFPSAVLSLGYFVFFSASSKRADAKIQREKVSNDRLLCTYFEVEYRVHYFSIGCVVPRLFTPWYLPVLCCSSARVACI